MNDLSPKRTDKFRAYRARKKAQGLREIRLWVPDVNAPGFREKLALDMTAIRASEDEEAVMRWCEAASADVWRDMD